MFQTKNIFILRIGLSLLASLGFIALICWDSLALAATAPNLGTTSTFGVVSDTLSNTNFPGPPVLTNITGAICGTTLNIPLPSIISGATVTPCDPQTGLDQGTALANLNAQALASSCKFIPAGTPLDAVVISGGLPGHYPPGCYQFGGAMDLTVSTTMTLDGAGIYIFSSVGALNTGADSSVILNGACASDVFWAPGGATTIGAYTIGGVPAAAPTFVGNIFDPAGITIGHFANLEGRALAFGGTVTTDSNTITVPTCTPFASSPGATTVPTLNEWGTIIFMVLAGLGAVYYLRKYRRV